MTSEKTLRRLGAAALALVGAIHLALAPEYLGEEAYIGVLFIAGGLASLFVSARLWLAPDRALGWFGAIVAACMFIGFVLSRTTGLPGFHESEWEPSGLVTLLLEAIYLGTFVAFLRSLHASPAQPADAVAIPFVAAASDRVAPRPVSGRVGPRRPGERVAPRLPSEPLAGRR